MQVQPLCLPLKLLKAESNETPSNVCSLCKKFGGFQNFEKFVDTFDLKLSEEIKFATMYKTYTYFKLDYTLGINSFGPMASFLHFNISFLFSKRQNNYTKTLIETEKRKKIKIIIALRIQMRLERDTFT
jgi:hypothetical protein